MRDLKKMSLTALVSLLATETVVYTQMLAGNKKTDEFYQCKKLIEQLTEEIESRKITHTASSSSLRRSAIHLRNK